MNPFMKAILAAAIPLISGIGSWITTGELKSTEFAVIITGFITAVLVYFFRNRPSGVLSALKFVLAAVALIVISLLQWAVTGSFNRAEMATIVVGVLTSILVYFVQNTPDR